MVHFAPCFIIEKNFPDDCFQVIFRKLSGMSPQGGETAHPFNNPAWKKFLWEGQSGSSSLCGMILDAHSVHQERYVSRICEAVGEHIFHAYMALKPFLS